MRFQAIIYCLAFVLIALSGCSEKEQTNPKPENEKKSLISAIARGNIEYVDAYLKDNPKSINEFLDDRSKTILGLAVFFASVGGEDIENQLALIEYLLKNGADINLRDKSGYSPLHRAAGSPTNNLKLFVLLLEKGADPRIRIRNNKFEKTPLGMTPLERAARRGHSEMVEILLKKGVPVSEELEHSLTTPSKYSKYYESAILQACQGKLAPCYRDKNGKTLPEFLGNRKVICQLLKKINNINEIQSFGGQNAFHFALDRGFSERAKVLLEKCPDLDVNARCYKGTARTIIEKSESIPQNEKKVLYSLIDNHRRATN